MEEVEKPARRSEEPVRVLEERNLRSESGFHGARGGVPLSITIASSGLL